MKKFISLCFTCFILMFSSQEGFGAWKGPIEIITGEWGSGVNQFGFEQGDTHDGFPYYFFLSDEGSIILYDLINSKIKLYDSHGILFRNIVPPIENPRRWVIKPILIESKILLLLDKIYYLSLKGDLVNKIDYPEQIQRINRWEVVNRKIYLEQAKPYKCVVLSSSCQLLETYKEKPLELGIVKGRSLGGKRYRTTIEYPDMTYTLNKGPYRKYIRLCKENIYAVSGKSAEIFNTSGEAIDKIIMPKDQINEISPGGRGMEAASEIIEQYGEPVVAPNGDVYTWKRTPDTYSILKWIWIESRDAPVNLKASASDGRISLSWEKPTQDAGTVKSYEIYRSSDVCGPFNKIKKVKKGVLQYTDKRVKEGETYYYQVCAERGSGYSGYSNKAIGSIKD